MNLIIRALSFTVAGHKTFRHILRNGFATAATGNSESVKVDCVTFKTLICKMHKAEGLNRAAELLDDHMRREKRLSPNENYRVLNEMFVNGFSPSVDTLNDVLRRFLRIGEMKNQMGDYSVNYNTLITDLSKAEELSHAVQLLDHMWRVKGLSPNETTYKSLIDYLCKQDRIDEAYKVLNEMILSGFYLSDVTLQHVFHGFLRIGEIGKAHNMRSEMDDHFFYRRSWMSGQLYPLFDGLRDEVTYTSLMNAYLDEGRSDYASTLHDEMTHLDDLIGIPRCDILPDSVIYSVIINGLDKKARTTEVKEHLLWFNDSLIWFRPTLEYHRTLAENCGDDEFKSLVELVEGFCNRGLENAYDTMLKFNYKPDGIVYNLFKSLVELVEGFCNSGLENAYDTMLKFNYKPDGIVYNLFIIEHCKCHNVDQAYNMYKEMVHYGFACHIFTVFALIRTLERVNQVQWVIQNVLRSCNLNDSEILKFLNEYNPDQHYKFDLFNVLAKKAEDGLFLKCSYAPPSA